MEEKKYTNESPLPLKKRVGTDLFLTFEIRENGRLVDLSQREDITVELQKENSFTKRRTENFTVSGSRVMVQVNAADNNTVGVFCVSISYSIMASGSETGFVRVTQDYPHAYEIVRSSTEETENACPVITSGRIVTGGGGSGVDARMRLVNHGTQDTTFALTPNTMHVWGEVLKLDLSLEQIVETDVVGEYAFQFTCPNAAGTTLMLPSSVKWMGEIVIPEKGKTYQASIVNGFIAIGASRLSRRIFIDGSNHRGTLIHQWRAENGFQNGLWLDDVTESKYSQPINLVNHDAVIENGYVVTQRYSRLSSNLGAFSVPAEQFGKFWEIELEIGPFVVAGSLPTYIFNMFPGGKGNDMVFDTLKFLNGNLQSEFYLNIGGTTISDGIHQKDVQYHGENIISFGIDDVGGGYGRHFIRVGDEKVYNTDPFIPCDIGKELKWPSETVSIGVPTGFIQYDQEKKLLIKRISIYRL